MKNLGIITLFLLAGSVSAGEIQWSGFGSVVGGKVISGETDPSGDVEFQADYYDFAYYTKEFNFKPETMFALQGRADLDNNLTITAQFVAKGGDNFRPDIDWLYATYHLSDTSYIMAGRRNLPMYYFSEYVEIGYAYPWMRPPANMYWWEVTQFNGVVYSKAFKVSNWSLVLNGFAGSEEKENMRSLDFWRLQGGFYVPEEAYIEGSEYVLGSGYANWTNIRGINLNSSNDWIDLRLSYFRTRYTTGGLYMIPGEIAPIRSTFNPVTDFDMDFFGASGSFSFKYVSALFDYNYVVYDDGYSSVLPTFLVTIVWNHTTLQPYISFNKTVVKLTEDYLGFGTGKTEEHQTATIGLRYNFHNNASLKIQFDDFRDNGKRGTGTGSTAANYDFSYHNDASLFTMGIDYVF